MKPSTEVLLSTAFVLTPKENWQKYGYAFSDDGPYCLVGALIRAARNYPTDAVYAEAYRVLEAIVGNNSVSGWNDAPGRTHSEVLDALYRAAEIAEAS